MDGALFIFCRLYFVLFNGGPSAILCFQQFISILFVRSLYKWENLLSNWFEFIVITRHGYFSANFSYSGVSMYQVTNTQAKHSWAILCYLRTNKHCERVNKWNVATIYNVYYQYLSFVMNKISSTWHDRMF